MRVIRGLFKAVGKTIKWTLILGALIVVVVIVAVIVKVGTQGHDSTKPTAVTGRVAGTFDRAGCLGCGSSGLVQKIATSDAYCGWSGSHVIVHVTMRNNSAEKATVRWHPTYSIVNGASHGTGLTSMQDTKIDAGKTESLFIRQSPKGVGTGTRIARCYPSFYQVTSG